MEKAGTCTIGLCPRPLSGWDLKTGTETLKKFAAHLEGEWRNQTRSWKQHVCAHVRERVHTRVCTASPDSARGMETETWRQFHSGQNLVFGSNGLS